MQNISIKFSWLLAVTLLFQMDAVLAHAEHDKPRYVATDGENSGRCDSPSKPCKTISYAFSQSNKGDRILVANGSYEVNTNNLFYLISDLIPVYGSYSRDDSYALKNAKNRTILKGVPLKFASQLSEQGFIAIVDQKNNKPKILNKLNRQLEQYALLLESKPAADCIDGMADIHPCSNVDLLGNISLSDMSATSGNDVWGHTDMNDNREYALMGLNNGVAVIEVTDPQNPRMVGKVDSFNIGWRDIKVYQFRDSEDEPWQSYAYVSAETSTSPDSTALEIIDLTGLPDSVSKVDYSHPFLGSHNILISNVNYSTGVANNDQQAFLHMAGTPNNGGSFNTLDLTDPTNPQIVHLSTTASRSDYSHDMAAMTVTDERVIQCDNENTNSCEILMDFNEDELRIWDKTDNANPQLMASNGYPNTAYTHSGWQTEDNMYVLVHDELDEQRFGINTRVIIFRLSDLCAPEMVATFNGPTSAIDHNGFVRGNKYYMSNYQRGMTVLDISNPENPTEIGYFDTYPMADSANFSGAWGVYPFLPSGNILVSDITSGLYILRDNSVTTNETITVTVSADSRCNQPPTTTPTTTTTTNASSNGGGYVSPWLLLLISSIYANLLRNRRKLAVSIFHNK